MENAIKLKNFILTAVAMLGSMIINLLGGWDTTLHTLIAAMAADYLTGLVVAGVFHRSGKTDNGALESRASFKGLIRKCVILLLVFLGALLDSATGNDLARTAVCLFFTANEGLSILENVGLMGVPYPTFLKNMLEVLRRQADSTNDSE